MPLTEMKAVREQLVDRLRAELEGPDHEDEVLNEPPCTRYACGILWPANTELGDEAREQDNSPSGIDDDPSPDMGALNVHSLKPSSIGLSFIVDRSVDRLCVKATWGEYRLERGEQGSGVSWARRPMSANVTVPIERSGIGSSFRLDADSGVFVDWISRPGDEGTAVSLFLVNRRTATKPEDSACLFQCRLEVRTPDGRPAFVARSERIMGLSRDPETIRDDLLYRDSRTFCVGHGTSATWRFADPGDRMAVAITSVGIPSIEVPKTIPATMDGLVVDMFALAEGDAADARKVLRPLLDRYDSWIANREREVGSLPETLKPSAIESVRLCRESLKRMDRGLDLLSADANALGAFRFANRVMALQRTHVLWAQQALRTNDWQSGPPVVECSWRPFQICFILQCLPGLSDACDEDRKIADLLWFPTGGGKTEAYLGLAAYTMALGRLRPEIDGRRCDAGVAVLMRYTLRLLTIQQFQRAATMVCACEVVRREDPDRWGAEPFRLGLWVGGRATPNSFKECREALEDSSAVDVGSPVQLVNCPWCGHKLTRANYVLSERDQRLRISCGRKGCEFRISGPTNDGIPALVVDDDIYRFLPSMMIGTVDKFARLPWVSEAGAIFGRVTGQVPGWGFVAKGERDATRLQREKVLRTLGPSVDQGTDERSVHPPRLVIQDELHLISGPLGTVAGAYETAIDYLSRLEGKGSGGPKVVASTATIRHAESQVRCLFNRRLAVFPAPGLTAADSFFAVRESLDTVPGQVYLGVAAFGKSMKTTLVRVYAALMASVGAIAAGPGDVDPYFTLVAYFNSLRELGGAKRLFEDDVLARMHTLALRKGSSISYRERSLGNDIPELTSRKSSREIPVILDRLMRPFEGWGGEGQSAEPAVLCSNMISVGVDIQRLGLMVVTGQPKLTSEYIQATNRIGRSVPGLVITVYNWARPRDLSHYERFRPYHEAFYRFVEGVSVTPFASRARDRALPGTFVTMCRHGIEGLSGHGMAGRFDIASPEVAAIRQWIVDRSNITGSGNGEPVRQHVQRVSDAWDNQKRKAGRLWYRSSGSKALGLMKPAEQPNRPEPLSVPNSMREVEQPLGVYWREG